ncbi:Tubulin epsilon and delta complex protein 2 [Camelus dromedarius]|uniref:Tubulin epsilon and delta complex protein 2 n=1 Tax=Camelus dromedarius TaxID=9838 RepID=A0A5N4BZJ4_CAMDR|nr:Tubulin epsilon and delta complex protein 2 [Camelus dromedarius]
MLPADCSRRLVAELRDALDSCAQRQRQLERSLRVSRRLLRAWEPAETPVPEPTPGPETDEKVPSSAFTACSPSPQDLKELELLTQVLEKAVRVRKGISKAGGDKDPSVKSEILLQLPMAFRKAASQNSRLWAQLSSTHTSDSGDAATTAKNHFLQKMQTTPSVLTAVVEQQLGPWPEGRLPRASSPCGGGADTIRSPPLLLYSSTQELQTLAALRLRVAMLNQQIHLEKVLMAELLPLVREQEPLGPPWLALCRAVHSLLCEGGERFLTILREDEPAD